MSGFFRGSWREIDVKNGVKRLALAMEVIDTRALAISATFHPPSIDAGATLALLGY